MIPFKQQDNNTMLRAIFEDGGNEIRYKNIQGILWICARDLAAPLNKSEAAIREQLKTIDVNWKGVIPTDTPGGIQNITFITKPAAIMIIMRTRASPGTKVYKFQKWASIKLDDLITSGRTSIDKAELEILRKTCANKTKELEQFQKEHEAKLKALEIAHDKKLKENERLKKFHEVIMLRTEKRNQFYIATCNSLKKQRLYKFGGVKDMSCLKSRLQQYNTGHPHEDQFYYVYIKPVYDYKIIENRINKLFPIQLKSGHSRLKEMIQGSFSAFELCVDYIIDHLDEEVDKINEFITQTMNLFTGEQKEEDPEPIVLDQLLVNVNVKRVGYLHKEEDPNSPVDISTLNEEEKITIVKELFSKFTKNKNDERWNKQDFWNFVEKNSNYCTKNKTDLWNCLKTIPIVVSIKRKYIYTTDSNAPAKKRRKLNDQ